MFVWTSSSASDASKDRASLTPAHGHNQALDGIRGIAALAVTLSHSAYVLFDSTHAHGIKLSMLATVMYAGHPSVIVFFALSGFVLYLAFAKQPVLHGTFLVRRVMRIYPALLAALALAAVLCTLVKPGPQAGLGPWTTYSWHSVDAHGVLRHVLLFGVVNDDTSLDSVIWSLAIEVRFSIVFPLLALLCRRSRLALIAVSVAAYIAGQAIFTYLGWHAPFLLGRTPLGTVAITLFYLPAFGFGIAAADLFLARRRRGAGLPRAVPAIAALAGLAVAHVVEQDFVWAVALTGLIFVVSHRGLLGGIARLPASLFFGRISYSLYLVHFPVLVAMVHLLNPYGGLIVATIVAPVVSVALAAASYRLIELPGVAAGRRLAGGLRDRETRRGEASGDWRADRRWREGIGGDDTGGAPHHARQAPRRDGYQARHQRPESDQPDLEIHARQS